MWLWRRVLISVNNERKEWWWFVEVANIMKEREREKMGQKKKVYLLREILKCFVKLPLKNTLSRIKWFELDPPIWHFSKKLFDKKTFLTWWGHSGDILEASEWPQTFSTFLRSENRDPNWRLSSSTSLRTCRFHSISQDLGGSKP